MNADPIAGVYRWLEYGAFGFALEGARFDFLSYAAAARRVLILGEGDGRFLSRFLKSNPQASVTVIETSARMIHLARRRVPRGDRKRVKFHRIDAVAESLPEGRFDLAVTHFFLDILDSRDAAAMIAKLSAVLSPGATWLISEFHVPRGRVRQLHARLWLRAMYGFFAAATGLHASKLPPYRDLLKNSGFTEVDYRERRLGLIRSQIWRKQT